MRVLLAIASVLIVLPGSGGRADPRLISALSTDQSPKVRAQAALSLSTAPADPDTVQALIQALRDPAAIVRGAAARALGILAPADAFEPLCQAALDRDPFVTKWALKSVRQVLAHAPVVYFSIRQIRVDASRMAAPSDRPARLVVEDMTRSFQEAVLEVLVGTGRFDIVGEMDFSDETDSRKPQAGPARATVGLRLMGGVERVAGSSRDARVEVHLKAFGPRDLLIWSGRGQGDGTAQANAEPDELADEYTIPAEAVDARVTAIQAAGRAAASELVRFLDFDETGAGRTSRGPRN